MKESRFIYQSIPESEGRMYDDVKNALEQSRIDKKKIFNILLAVSEAFTNALVHANNYNADKKIEVKITANDKYIIADIIDEGPGLADRPDCDMSDRMAEGGRGLALMKRMADKIEIKENRRTGGTEVSMQFVTEILNMKNGNEHKMEGMMEIIKRETGNVVTFALSGRLDLGNGNKLKEEVKAALASGKTSVHLNLKQVEFVNSSGLGALVSIMKDVRVHRGRLTLSDMADYVREIFDITQLSHIFEIFATEQEALNSYQPISVG
jgi:anti-sigma B factor antagonist